MDRWRLPGPAGFLDQILTELRQGSSIVVGAPSCVAPALQAVLEDRIAEDWRLTELYEPVTDSPIDQLYDRLDIRDGRTVGRTVASLAEDIKTKQVVFVCGINSSHWTAWDEFIDGYADASRSRSEFDRSPIVLVVSGVPRDQLPARAPALKALVWDGCVGESDVFAYAINAWRATGRPVDAKAKLIARIVIRLALWDFDLIDQMMALHLDELLDPISILRKLDDRSEAWAATGGGWEHGGTADFDGTRMTHSFVLARGNDARGELTMRLWAAQAAELLPALELRRRKLAERIQATGKIPRGVRLNDEEVIDLSDVEIGGLCYLAYRYRLPQDIVRTAEKYRDIRNRLAHLETVTAQQILELL